LVEFPAVNIADFELAFADGLQSGVPDQSVITIRNPKSPIEKVVESAGNAPASACLQGRCIACLPRPREDLRFTICASHLTEAQPALAARKS